MLPTDPLVLYDKLIEPVGCLAACLMDALATRFAAGMSGKLDALNVDAAIPADVRARMLEPIRADRHVTTLPTFGPATLAAFQRATLPPD